MLWMNRMMTFTVHEPASPPADKFDRAESLVFVKDGFAWLAALWAPLWLVSNRLWLALGVYVVVAGSWTGLFWAMGLGQRPISYLLTAINLIVAFEGDVIRRWTLERQGWRMLGSVSGRTADECERRFFEIWLPNQPYVAASGFGPSTVASGAVSADMPSQRPVPESGGWRSVFPVSKPRGS